MRSQSLGSTAAGVGVIVRRNDNEVGEEDNLEGYDADGQKDCFEYESTEHVDDEVEAPSSPSCPLGPIVGSQDSSIFGPSVPVSEVETPPFTLGMLGSIRAASKSSA
ncbi:hypothetical protein CDL15_Pgr001193 [Punica granatum]|uniref:Uncharacterized protein n=1 Tax=Punica granatum TaxID=22663 RepID=A0A218WKT8_PUNGR|nr:hypothetical protein CDL15_Pgr001193 [Punica granatum]